MAQIRAPWSATVETFNRFDDDVGNLRQVLGGCLAERDAETGLRMCTAMAPVWIVRGSFAEGAEWFDSFLGLGAAPVPAAVRGPALVGRAQLALAQDSEGAQARAAEGLELCRAAGQEFWTATALNLLTEAALHAGRADEAAARADQALATARMAGDRWNEGYALGTMAAVAGQRLDLPEAQRLGEAALAIMRDIDQQWGVARTLLGLADLARLTGDPGGAQRRYEEALAILKVLNARPEIARCLAGLGRIATDRGDTALARRHLAQSIELSRSTGSRIGMIRGLEAFATLAVAEQRPDQAVELAAAAAALRQAAHLPPQSGARTERYLTAARGLGQETVTRLWAEGASLDASSAVELALTAPPPRPAPGPVGTAAPGGLTPREREIVALIVQGRSNKAIGEELVISPATAARHIANILLKLGFSSRAQVAAWAARAEDRSRPPGPDGARPPARRARPNSALTDSPSWMRRMASASAGATEITCSLGSRSSSAIGTVLVQTTSVTSGCSAIRFSAPSLNSPWVQAMRTERAPCSRSRVSSSMMVVPRAISSSRTITSRSATSPMIELIVTRVSLCRSLAPAATGRPSIRASSEADLALPRSGETTTAPARSWRRKWAAISRSACRWSTGTEKNPWTCGACKVIVSIRLAPAVTSRSATSRPPIDTRGMVFLSDRA